MVRALQIIVLVLLVSPSPVPAQSVPVDEMRRIRRHLHQHPELSNREAQTQAYLRSQFEEAGFDRIESIAGTGLRIVHDTGKDGATLAFRADIDGLPLNEATQLPFASKIDGVMHACGHDMHAAILYGLALAVRGDPSLTGKFVFLFQPSEEGAPVGEDGGALRMIDEGALTNPVPDAIFALHAMDHLNVGEVGIRPGPVLAQASRISLTVTGEAGHPLNKDQGSPLHAISEIVFGCRLIQNDMDSPGGNVIISLGELRAGSRYNILPSTAVLNGSIRAMSGEMVDEAFHRVEQMVAAVCEKHALKFQLRDVAEYPLLVNDLAWSHRIRNQVDDESFAWVDVEPIMAADDFAYFAEEIPGVYFFLGVADSDTDSGPLHSPSFNPSEQALEVGFRLFYSVARAMSVP